MMVLDTVMPTDNGVRVSYQHGNATEWYVRQGGGVEQGITLATPPAGNGTLTLDIATPGVIPLIATDGMSATLIQPSGGQWQYNGLHVTDATGKTIPAYLVPREGGLGVVVADADATYPLTVDPYIQSQALADPHPANPNNNQFGYAVAMSGDGNTIVVGASTASAAYVFTKNGSSFGTTPNTTFSDPNGYGSFGTAVAISADASTIVVSSPNETMGSSIYLERMEVATARPRAHPSPSLRLTTATTGSGSYWRSTEMAAPSLWAHHIAIVIIMVMHLRFMFTLEVAEATTLFLPAL